MELGKLAEIVRGSSPRPKGDSRYYGPGVPRLMVSDVTRDGMYVTPKIDSLTLEGAKKSRPMKKGDFVIAVSGDPGEPCILAVDACIHDGFVGLRNLCKDRLNEQYLYQYFKYVKIKNQSQAVGAIYKNLNTDQVKKLKIPLPPLLIQRKIAEVLDAADHIRQRNKEVLAKYDQLAQSVFLEMFGDIIYKQELYKIEIGKACKFIDYRGKTPMRVEAGIPLISAKCVRAGWFDKSRIDFIEESTYDKVMVRGFPKSGDVLFTTEGHTMGFTCQIPDIFQKFAVGQRIITLRSNEGFDNTFVRFLLNIDILQIEIAKRATGSAAQGIRSAEFKKIKIPRPPLVLQNQFATIIERIEQQKAQAQAELDRSEELFQSLMQRAFKGDLFPLS